ncbi:methionyl-tRNA formyltransferase [Candidatus Wolfebacteria bacterium]|nr:methionyl-tRNA formyltransferase [Candidatus Wolfebacteria bacterium]
MNLKFAYFGTPPFSVRILEELQERGFTPSLVVTAPDKKAGRGLTLTAPAVKVWAEKNNIPVIQPESLKEIPIELKDSFDMFVVAAYGKILSEELINLPRRGTLNVHPSLLPKYRGASPIEGQILGDEQHIGVTIMHMDKKMDHGPIVLQREKNLPAWPIRKNELTRVFAAFGGELLAEVMNDWCDGKIKTVPQNHDEATFTKKLKRGDGEINFADDPYKNFLKFCAFFPWPGTFFFADGVRIKISDATFHNDEFIPTKVIPEGKKEVRYRELTGYNLPLEAPKQ